MLSTITRVISGTAGLLLLSLAGVAQADDYNDLEHQAQVIQRQAIILRREAAHYRHTPHYRHLINDSNSLTRSATHLRRVAHHRGSLADLQADLREVNSAFQHLRGILAKIERDAQHGNGHRHGDARDVHVIVHAISQSIHHMNDDIDSIRQSQHHRPVVSRSDSHGRRVYVGRGGGHGGVTLQRGGVQLRFNF